MVGSVHTALTLSFIYTYRCVRECARVRASVRASKRAC